MSELLAFLGFLGVATVACKAMLVIDDAYRDLCYKPVCHKCGGEVRVSTHRRPWYCIEEHGRTEADWIRVTTLREEIRAWLRSENHGVSD